MAIYFAQRANSKRALTLFFLSLVKKFCATLSLSAITFAALSLSLFSTSQIAHANSSSSKSGTATTANKSATTSAKSDGNSDNSTSGAVDVNENDNSIDGMNGDEGSSPNQHLGLQGNQDNGLPYQDKNGQALDSTRRMPHISDDDHGDFFLPLLTVVLAILLAAAIAYIVGHRNGRRSNNSPEINPSENFPE